MKEYQGCKHQEKSLKSLRSIKQISILKLTLLTIVICLISSITFAKPIAVPIQSNFDLGEVYSGEKVFVMLQLENKGDEPLEIFALDTNCPCVEFIYPERDKKLIPSGDLISGTHVKKTVQPKETVNIPALFAQSNSYSNLEKIVTVSTNDPDNLNIVYKVKGFAKPIAKVTPASHFPIGEAKAGSVHTQKVIITPTDKKFKLGKAYYSGKNVKVTYKPLKDELGSYEVTLKVTVPDKKGSFFEKIEIDTDLPSKPILLLMTSATVK